MKKTLFLILAVLMLLGLTASVHAEGTYTRDSGYRVKTIAIVSALAPGKVALDSTIVVGNSVLGYTYTDSAAGVCVLYDVATAATRTTSTIMGEVKVAAGTAETVMFPFPKKIENGFVAASTTSTGALVVYYE